MQLQPKYLICYLGMGNSIVLKEACSSRHEAMDYIRKLDVNDSSLQNSSFFVIESTEVIKE